jgi:hypothetical protein
MLCARIAATAAATRQPRAAATASAIQNGSLSARTELAVRRSTTTSLPLGFVA